jgi:hypothetical protein
LPDVALDYGYFFFQLVVRHAAARHIGHLRLYLDTREMFTFRFRRQQYGDNARPRTQIQHRFAAPNLREPCQYHGVYPETKLLRVLYQHIAVAVQVVKAFVPFQHFSATAFLNTSKPVYRPTRLSG